MNSPWLWSYRSEGAFITEEHLLLLLNSPVHVFMGKCQLLLNHCLGRHRFLGRWVWRWVKFLPQVRYCSLCKPLQQFRCTFLNSLVVIDGSLWTTHLRSLSMPADVSLALPAIGFLCGTMLRGKLWVNTTKHLMVLSSQPACLVVSFVETFFILLDQNTNLILHIKICGSHQNMSK